MKKMTLEFAKSIIEQFDLQGELVAIAPFGEGHINSTFSISMQVADKEARRYMLQSINTYIFKNPKELMQNILSVTEYLKQKIELRGGDSMRETLTVVKTKNGELFYQIGDNCYRIYHFIEHTTCYQNVNKKLFYASAKAFGRFAKELDGFDAENMFDIIKNFHDTKNRYENLAKAVDTDKFLRSENCTDEITFAGIRKKFCSIVLDEIENGNIPLRVCHNDTKLNNVLFDNSTNNAICVIDLDTVMKGSLLYDFGDAIRFGASSALEDEENLDIVYCDLEKYEMYVKGFLEEASDILSKREFELLAQSAILITLECGMRFLTDYLEGDVYFKTAKENHNLIRARNQFKLVADMENKLDEMKTINEKYR